jgi:hypothetical protein
LKPVGEPAAAIPDTAGRAQGGGGGARHWSEAACRAALFHAAASALRVHAHCVVHEAGVRRCKKSRIVRLGFGTARQKRVLERWTNPKPLQPIWDRAAI